MNLATANRAAGRYSNDLEVDSLLVKKCTPLDSLSPGPQHSNSCLPSETANVGMCWWPTHYSISACNTHWQFYTFVTPPHAGHLLDMCACVGNQLQALPQLEDVPRLLLA